MKTITTFLFIFLFVAATAQNEILNPTKLENWELKGYAESALRAGDTYSAIDFYKEYHKRNPEDRKVALVLGDLCFSIHDYAVAKDIYLKLYNKNPKKYLVQYYYYAETLKAQMQYEDAIGVLKIFIKQVKKEMKGQQRDMYLYLAQIKLSGCKYALSNKQETNLQETDDSLVVKHLNSTINKAHLETAPFIYNDTTFIYSSLVAERVPQIKISDGKKAPKNKFYAAKLVNNQWKGGFDAPKPFYNFDSLETANGVFSKDKQRFYFTSSVKNRMNKMISHIYVSQLINEQWTLPTKLNAKINLKNYTSTQPAIGASYLPNLEIIYFISDRPHGVGGMDIWFTVYDTNTQKYKKPVNAGRYINTISDEVTPYYDDSSKELYYSSNGLPGLGGFDIYKAQGWGASWKQAKNIGLPINSSFDDLYFCHNATENEGFVVSNRSESVELYSPNCCYDIFEFSYVKKAKKEELLAWADTSITKNKPDELLTSIDNNVTLNKQLENYILKTMKQQATKPYKKLTQKAVAIDNIYFDFDSAVLKPESKVLIDSTIYLMMKKYYNIVVEISAHTDGKGSSNYNLDLSQKRAQSVVNYLLSKGIHKRKMTAIGYGEKQPLLPEVDEKGNDLPDARKKNRRIEFKITGIEIPTILN